MNKKECENKHNCDSCQETPLAAYRRGRAEAYIESARMIDLCSLTPVYNAFRLTSELRAKSAEMRRPI